MKAKQFTILALGVITALMTIMTGTMLGPAQAHPNPSFAPTPGKVQPFPDSPSTGVKTEYLLQLPLEAGPLSPSSMGIINGDFESGRTGWVEYSLNGWPLILHRDDLPVDPHSGNWAVWLGGDYNEIAYISQTVSIPTASVLTFWEWIGSEDLCGYDFARVRINNTNVATINLCEEYNTNGWVNRTVDLSTYAGQTVSLQIRVETDSSLNSNYFVDDVALSGLTGERYVYLPLVLRNFWAGFFDDFSNPNSGWCIEETTDFKMGYLNGEYQILLKRPNIGYMCTPDLRIPVSNYTVQVDARMASSSGGSYSLVFGIRWGVNTRENYVVSVDPDTQYYRIQRKNADGSWTTLVNWTYSSLIKPGAQTNRLRIDRWGTNILFSVNGFFVTMVSDSNIIGTGLDAGVGVNSYNNVPVDVRFDNFRVSQP
ncbi:MAG: immune inhibitor A [Anaerolineae bacterium]|nr:immune inhibitor A [Anaerolineae bacterium]